MSRSHPDDFERLVQAALRVSSSDRLESICRHILEGAREVVRAEAASLLLVDPERGCLAWFAASGEVGETLTRHDLALDEGVAGWVARTGESVLLGDAAADPRFCSRIDALSGFVTRALICVPLVARGQILGVLELINPPPDRPYDASDVRKAQAFAGLSAVALEHHRLAERARTAATVRETARARRDLTARLVEKIRAPLTAVRGFSDVLIEGDAPLDTLRDYAARIAHETRRIEGLVEGFSELACIESGETPLREEMVDLRDTLEAARARWTPRCARHRLTVGLPAAPSTAMADPQRLGQVLDLLIDNAVRHSPDGGEIALAAERRADGWRVWVTDEGPGLPQESVARLFHPFHAETSSGAGLGLSLARALVERMHGRIGVDDRRARGAAFWFTVPASSRA